MAMPIKNIESLLADLELDTPDVYIKCVVSLPDKKGNLYAKTCILNLKTGDVFKNRKLLSNESANFRIARRYGLNIEEISHFAHQRAQVFDGHVVLTTWIFGDYVNQPGTSRLVPYYCDPTNIDGAPRGNKVHPDALLNVILSKPKIAAVVTVSENKEIAAWEDLDKYGLMMTEKHIADRSEYLTSNLIKALHQSYESKRIVGLTESFKHFFEVGYVGANRYLTFDSYKDVAVFMKAKSMRMKNNDHQNMVNELAAMPLPDHAIVPMSEKTICYADRVNDEWTVLRWWVRSQTAKYLETHRMYVNKTDTLHCRSDLKGNWIHSGVKIKAITFNADRVILQHPGVLDGTKLGYFKSISAEMSNQSAALYMLSEYPEFEKMYKIGLDWLCDCYIKSPYQTSWRNHLEEYVGYVDWCTKNIYKMIGINRHQIKAINAFIKIRADECDGFSSCGYWQERSVRTIIQQMKRIFGINSLNSIDNESFDYILNSITLSRLTSVYVNGLAKTFQMYGKDAMYFIKDLNAISRDEDYIIEVMSQYGYRSHMNIDRLYFDTMSMIETGEYMDVIRPRFSAIEELVNHHQVMIDLINADQMAHEARTNKKYESGFDANHKRWEKWEWDGDQSEFCVIAPSKPVDVAAEGITLRHCVKSYIPSVSQGQTNIMFIRRKGKETEPFFTVEVDMQNRIRQVHGMCNCNVSSVQGLGEFVDKWSKVKKLKYRQSQANAVRAVE